MLFKSHIKLHVLKELNSKSLSGYDLMKSASELLDKKPSAGYIYPLLKDLGKKGYISMVEKDRRKIYHITSKGRSLLSELQNNREEMMRRMRSTLQPIASKKEIENFVELKSKFHEHKALVMKDTGEFHKILFKLYDNYDLKTRKKIISIINESTKKLNELL